MYVLTVPNGPWVYVLVTELVALAGIAASAILLSRAGIWIGRDAIAERGFFGSTRVVPVDDIGSIVLVQTFEDEGIDSLPQFFVCDAAGKQLIRMRGQYWSRKKMNAVGKLLRIVPTEIHDPVSSKELLEEYPGLLYWFERHPRLFASFFIAAVIVGGVILYVVITAVGSINPIN